MYQKQTTPNHRSAEYAAGFVHGVYAHEDGIAAPIGHRTGQPGDWLIGFYAGWLIRQPLTVSLAEGSSDRMLS